MVSIDARKVAPDRWEVFSHGSRKATGWEAVEWAKRAVSLGAGEIVLNSIDADGTKEGFDLVITRRISEAVGVPVVASGGAGKLEHMAEVLLEGKADAVLAASIFHFGDLHRRRREEVPGLEGHSRKAGLRRSARRCSAGTVWECAEFAERPDIGCEPALAAMLALQPVIGSTEQRQHKNSWRSSSSASPTCSSAGGS